MNSVAEFPRSVRRDKISARNFRFSSSFASEAINASIVVLTSIAASPRAALSRKPQAECRHRGPGFRRRRAMRFGGSGG
jgi:hypothetical protein